MNRQFFLIFCLLFVFSGFAGAQTENDIIELTNETFSSRTATDGDWFILFYAPWCPHCQRLKPTWGQLATETKGQLNVAMVNCDEYATICGAYGVRGYPTMYLRKADKIYEFNGERSLENLKLFVAGQYQQAIARDVPVLQNRRRLESTFLDRTQTDGDIMILTDENFRDIVVHSDDWFIMFYAPWCPHCKKLKPTWKSFAAKNKNKINVGMVDCDEEKHVCGAYQVTGYPTVYLQKNGVKYGYNGQRTVESLEQFMDQGYKNEQGSTIPKTESDYSGSETLKGISLMGAMMVLISLLVF